MIRLVVAGSLKIKVPKKNKKTTGTKRGGMID